MDIMVIAIFFFAVVGLGALSSWLYCYLLIIKPMRSDIERITNDMNEESKFFRKNDQQNVASTLGVFRVQLIEIL